MMNFKTDGYPFFGKPLTGINKYQVDCGGNSEKFDTVDECIMWAVLKVNELLQKNRVKVTIRKPDREIVKSYDSYDALIEDLWETLTDVPMNPETEDMDADWFIFPKGVNRESIWEWFDEEYSKGVGNLIN